MKSMTDSEAAVVLHGLKRVFEYKAQECIAKGHIKYAAKNHRRVQALDKAINRLEGSETHATASGT